MMTLPKALARLNRAGLNRIARRIAPWLPWLGVVVHRGRRSGRLYRTPVHMFAGPDGYVFALTYGPDSDWVRNVRAAGGCDLESRGHRVRLTEPRLIHDETRAGIRQPERYVLGLLRVSDFLALKIDGSGSGSGSGSSSGSGSGPGSG